MELGSLVHALLGATLWYAKPRGFHPSPEADHVRDCHREELLGAWLYHVGLNGPIGLAGLEPARVYEAVFANYSTAIVAV